MDELYLNNTSKLSDFIFIKENVLDKDFCLSVIEKFNIDERKDLGRTLRGIDLTLKKSTDLDISKHNDWQEEDKIFFTSLSTYLIEYCNKYNYCLIKEDTGYQIQETKIGEFYHWHHDYLVDYENRRSRKLTYIWYLNTMNDGGYTEFIDGTRIYPETGKLIIFPATWTYIHRGVSPVSKTKYICTGWAWS